MKDEGCLTQRPEQLRIFEMELQYIQCDYQNLIFFFFLLLFLLGDPTIGILGISYRLSVEKIT